MTVFETEVYNEIYENPFGHINYALTSYCVENNHLNCLKNLYENLTYLQWHNDLAIVALENNNPDCLKYIVETMGDVRVTPEIVLYLKNNTTIKKLNNINIAVTD